MKILTKLFRKKMTPSASNFDQHARLKFEHAPDIIYAVGDIHGELNLLLELEQKIAADAASYSGEKWLIYIGDYIDRGAKSAQVIDHLIGSKSDAFKRKYLLGNHEFYLLEAIRGNLPVRTWMRYGGLETLLSYYGGELPHEILNAKNQKQLEFINSIVPQNHIEFLSKLTLSISMPQYFFVHAGIKPEIDLDDQEPMDLLTMRDGFIDQKINRPETIVHGHTIVDKAMEADGKLSIDTGAYATQILTAARIVKDQSSAFITT